MSKGDLIYIYFLRHNQIKNTSSKIKHIKMPCLVQRQALFSGDRGETDMFYCFWGEHQDRVLRCFKQIFGSKKHLYYLDRIEMLVFYNNLGCVRPLFSIKFNIYLSKQNKYLFELSYNISVLGKVTKKEKKEMGGSLYKPPPPSWKSELPVIFFFRKQNFFEIVCPQNKWILFSNTWDLPKNQ